MSKQLEHSPGPWKAAGVHGGVLQYVVDAENWEVCVPRTQADIRLIAAAPDMLRLMREILNPYVQWNELGDHIAEARKLIAKLDGQQP